MTRSTFRQFSRVSSLLPLALAFGVAPCLGGSVRVVNSRSVALCFDAEGTSVDTAHVWTTTDDGQTWRECSGCVLCGGAVTVTADRDGRVGYWLVLENAAGRSAEPPQPGQPPQTTVLIDTQPPLLQLHGARVIWDGGAATLAVHATLSEENLEPSAARLFVRGDAKTAWRDIGALHVEAGRAALVLPTDFAGVAKIDVCVIVTDLAGNRSREMLTGVVIPQKPKPATATALAAALGPVSQAAPPAASSVPADAPVGPPAWAAGAGKARAAAPPETVLNTAEMARLNQLRRVAADFAANGKWDLAAARYDEAAKLLPNDAETELNLGQSLLQLNKLEDATKHFNTVITQKPDNAAALEALALISATQHDYASARGRLKRLTELQPQAAPYWLRYGDVEYKLGNQRDAQAAWDKALQLSAGDADGRQRALARIRQLGGQQAASVSATH